MQGGPVGRRDRRGLLRRAVNGVAGPNHAATYDLLCEKQFGLGASFDGEMCACKKGLSVSAAVCGDARASVLLCCCAAVGARARAPG